MNFITSLLSADRKTVDTELENATYENTESFLPEIKSGKVVRVYDGDTITIATRIQTNKLYRFNVRLRGIDTPELKTTNANEKQHAVLARDDLSGFILNTIVKIENVAYDKYGRILADVLTVDGVNLSNWMIDRGNAVKYDGGKKQKPAEWNDGVPLY